MLDINFELFVVLLRYFCYLHSKKYDSSIELRKEIVRHAYAFLSFYN